MSDDLFMLTCGALLGVGITLILGDLIEWICGRCIGPKEPVNDLNVKRAEEAAAKSMEQLGKQIEAQLSIKSPWIDILEKGEEFSVSSKPNLKLKALLRKPRKRQSKRACKASNKRKKKS